MGTARFLPSAPSIPCLLYATLISAGTLLSILQQKTTWYPGQQVPGVPLTSPTPATGLHFLLWPSPECPHAATLRNCRCHSVHICC